MPYTSDRQTLNSTTDNTSTTSGYTSPEFSIQCDQSNTAVLADAERKTTEEIVKQQLTAFRRAVSAAGILAVTDVTGKIIEVNDNFCEVSGYAREELIGQDHRILQSGQHNVQFLREMYSTIGRGKIWRGEICDRAKDGSLYWMDTTIAPMLNESGKPHSYFALRVDISDRKRLEGCLHELAYHDTLTGLANRDAILQSIQASIGRSSQHQSALLFLDFDRFKLVNDSLGHDVGDQLLIAIAKRLSTTLDHAVPLANSVIPARLGGDEFVVLLEGLKRAEDATIVAERLLRVFSKSYKLGNHTVYSSASIGIVTSTQEYTLAREMLRDADLAMYEAKATGKANYVVFDCALRDKAKARLKIENEIRLAIEREEFSLLYQPIVSLESGRTESVEALIRWKNEDGELIEPEEFISIAEETGMIVPIGNWVLREACRQIAQWEETLGPLAPVCVHVNVSRRQLALPNFASFILETTQHYGVEPGRLHIEVTESMIMHDREASIAILCDLKELGFKIDIDDFGTGYSSLSCLHAFPIDVLKIDREFVSNLNHGQDFGALLHTIVALADNLNLKVVAEGIENTNQLTLIQALGCEFGQGYLFSKPLLPEDLEQFLRNDAARPPCHWDVSPIQTFHLSDSDPTDPPHRQPMSVAASSCGSGSQSLKINRSRSTL
ncbi:putative bifunctional diguanylate cyclase/phosphodiesterase [Rubripirellula lacrimiformis]|uniref:putative bifunctional diguanylate cyclase/phosphodiesterase n=1 Tax=Rubripirellula lacrimiformis TaxID=1930273 RepID=UPI001C54EEC5|nr:EAL domain-containing protein [Rubripirellula lacrimiformis]